MGGGAAWWRRAVTRTRTLRALARDTLKALDDVADVLQCDPEISSTIQSIAAAASRSTAIVILGTSGAARARLVHCLLDTDLLPHACRGHRWVCIQYGSTPYMQLTLGALEFELINELKAKEPFHTLPTEDLLRQDATDLTTMLEVQVNSAFLKDGLKIIIPPDLDQDPTTLTMSQIKEKYSELFSKRESILKNYNCVFLYAIDRTGKNVFSENISFNKMAQTKSEEDFWNFSLFSSKSENEVSEKIESVSEKCVREVERLHNEPSVFTPENCLDLQQIKQYSPNAQVYFILFSDSVEIESESDKECREDQQSSVTESTDETPESDRDIRREESHDHRCSRSRDERRCDEEQTAFMNELLDQWELMTTPPLKHYVKSQWSIISDGDILRTAGNKSNIAPHTHSHTPLAATCARGCRHEGDRTVRGRGVLNTSVVKYAADCCQSYVLELSNKLSEVHVKLLQQFILASFDMARELQVVPKKIQYVATQEQHLYETISERFSEGEKKQELLQLMQEVLDEMTADVHNMDWCVDNAPCHQDRRFMISNSIFYSSRMNSEHVSLPIHVKPPTRPNPINFSQLESINDSEMLLLNQTRLLNQNLTSSPIQTGSSCQNTQQSSLYHDPDSLHQTASDEPDAFSSNDDVPSDGEEATDDGCDMDDYEVVNYSDETFSASHWCTTRQSDTSSLIGTIPIENESEMFSISSGTRLLSPSLFSGGTTCTNSLNIPVKHASIDVQKTVLSKLSRKISLKLVKFVDCLKDSYFGTLQRCLQSLEWSCRQELGGRPASEAMRQLLSVARQVDLQPCASFSLLRTFVQSIRMLLQRLRLGGGLEQRACCVLSPSWRRHVALHALHALTPQRLAKIISRQIMERLTVAHERYQSALTSLEAALSNRLTHTEDVKLAIRKRYAPSFARLCLESTSMCDLLMYGVPDLGREIGRGQYGVVYSVRGAWGGNAPAAVKSVLPQDERHYHELAMEFFYARSIPRHPRIVRLMGSVVQRHAAGPAVLLVTERRVRDLHTAVKHQLTYAKRMQIACDIIEGIRYLHSLGLVHRDIKMKNVLLDASDRAALSDLGFCACDALLTGSVVGTPVHMAPELLHGHYHMAVDVYAAGILFWYLFAGNVKLPSAYETFQNKEQLWSKVKKGLRPERLPHFSDECWSIMESCWHPEPAKRALLGDIQPRLEALLKQALEEESGETRADCNEHGANVSHSDDDGSLGDII